MHHKRLPVRQRLGGGRCVHGLIFADELNRHNLQAIQFRLPHEPLTQGRPQHCVGPGEHRKLKLKMSEPQQIDEPVCLERFDRSPDSIEPSAYWIIALSRRLTCSGSGANIAQPCHRPRYKNGFWMYPTNLRCGESVGRS